MINKKFINQVLYILTGKKRISHVGLWKWLHQEDNKYLLLLFQKKHKYWITIDTVLSLKQYFVEFLVQEVKEGTYVYGGEFSTLIYKKCVRCAMCKGWGEILTPLGLLLKEEGKR